MQDHQKINEMQDVQSVTDQWDDPSLQGKRCDHSQIQGDNNKELHQENSESLRAVGSVWLLCNWPLH